MVLKSHVLDFRIFKIQYQNIILNPIQLHLFLIQFSFFVILVFINLNSEEFNSDDVESQLNQKTSDSHKDSADIFIQTL